MAQSQNSYNVTNQLTCERWTHKTWPLEVWALVKDKSHFLEVEADSEIFSCIIICKSTFTEQYSVLLQGHSLQPLGIWNMLQKSVARSGFLSLKCLRFNWAQGLGLLSIVYSPTDKPLCATQWCLDRKKSRQSKSWGPFLTEVPICELRKAAERPQQKARGGNRFTLQDSGTTPATQHWQQERETGKKSFLVFFWYGSHQINLLVHDKQL